MQKSYLALVGLLGLAVSVQAADIVINANVGTQQNLAVNECIIVTPTGDLTVASLGGSPAIVGAGNNEADIQAGGNVSANSLGGSPAIQFNGGGTVNVSGSVTTNSLGGSAGVFFNNSVAGVVNIFEGGQISTSAVGASPGIFSDGQVTVVVNGNITTDSAAISAAISAGDDSIVTVGLNGTINTNGAISPGISLGNNATVQVDGAMFTNGTAVTVGENSNVTIGSTGTLFPSGSGVIVQEGSTAVNNGIINATGLFGSGMAGFEGISGEPNVNLTNNGTIAVSGSFASGLFSGDTSTGTNTGIIDLQGSDSLNGISLGDNSMASNSGTITNDSDRVGLGTNYGINVGANSTGENSGTITVNGTNGRGVNGGDGSMVSNTSAGTINVNGNGTIPDPSAGLAVGANGTATNDGTITVMADNAGGIIVGDNSIANNTGTVMTDGMIAPAVFLNGTGTTLNNSGTLQSDGSNSSTVFSLNDATVNNTGGTIMSSGASSPTVNIAGGTVNNTGGTISADVSAGVQSTANVLTLNNTSGGMIMGEDAVNLNAGGEVNNMDSTIAGNDRGISKTGDGGVTVNNTKGTISAGNNVALRFNDFGGDDVINNHQGQIFTNGSSRAIRAGDGNDIFTDIEGQIWNAGGTRVISMGGGTDTVNLTGTTVTRTGDAITDDAIRLGGQADALNIFGFADINGTMNGNGGADDLCMELWGVSADQVVAASTEGTATDNGDGTVTLSETGTLDFGAKVYRWTSFNGSATVKVVSLLAIPGLTPNQQAIGAALNPAFQGNPGADMQFVLGQIIQVGTGNFADIANQLSPQPFSEAFRRTGINNASFLDRQIDGHMDSLFTDGFESGDTSAWSTGSLNSIGVNASNFVLIDPTQNLKFQNWDRRLASLGVASGVMSDVPGAAFGGLDLASTDDAKAMYDGKQMIEAPMNDPRRFGVWLAGQGILADVDQADGDVEDFNYDTASVTVGLDYRITREVVLGVLFNWGNTDAALDGNGSRQETNTYTGGLYAGWQSQDDGWFANGYVIGGGSDYNQSRRIAFAAVNRTAYSDPEGWQLTTGVNSGYLFNLNRAGTWQFGPIWGLQYTHLELDNYTETGAGALNLAVGQQEIDSLRSALGMKVKGRWQVSSEVALEPILTAEWLHEFLDDSTGVTGAFSDPAPGSFIVNTQNPDREFGLVGLALNALIGVQWSAFLSYDAQFSEQYLAHGISGGARFEF